MTVEYRRGGKHVYRHVAGEHLLIALHRDAQAPMFALTATAAHVWQHLGDWVALERLADALVERYDVSQGEAMADVQELVEQLQTIGALEKRER